VPRHAHVSLQKYLTVAALLLGITVSAATVRAEYTSNDLGAAATAANQGNVEPLKKIFEDRGTPHAIRLSALSNARNSGAYRPCAEYLDTPFMDEHTAFAAIILSGSAVLNTPKWNDKVHYPKAIASMFESGEVADMYQVQRMHVLHLIKDGQGQEALRESKRLIGLAPIHEGTLIDAVQVIGTAVRAAAIAQGKSIKEAIAHQNAYLEAVQKGDLSQTEFAKAAFPAANASAAAAEQHSNARVRIDALIFNGRYDVAEKFARGEVAAAMNDEALSLALQLVGRVLNGKTGSPTAVNQTVAKEG